MAELLQVICPFSHPTNSVKELKDELLLYQLKLKFIHCLHRAVQIQVPFVCSWYSYVLSCKTYYFYLYYVRRITQRAEKVLWCLVSMCLCVLLCVCAAMTACHSAQP